ncbi:MAG TPA: cupin domain-containing protein [Bacteroidales bacterium]|nr:cupin domain-containing protein [Bacteroidales bacterium]
MIKPTDGAAKTDEKIDDKVLRRKELEHEKSKSFIIVEIIEYVPNSVVIKTIIKKTTGNVTVSSFDTGEALTEKTSPFDTFIQVIDGKAEIVIDGNFNLLNTGESIIIPAHSRNIIKASERFKMISTIIKSGYDEVI